MSVTPVSDETFERDVLRSKAPTLLTVWREGCPPCEYLTRAVIELSREHGGLHFAHIESPANPETMQRYNVTVCPQMLLFKDGAFLGRWKGAIPKEKVSAWITRTLGA